LYIYLDAVTWVKGILSSLLIEPSAKKFSPALDLDLVQRAKLVG